MVETNEVIESGDTGPEVDALRDHLRAAGFPPAASGPLGADDIKAINAAYRDVLGMGPYPWAGPMLRAALVAEVSVRERPGLGSFRGRVGFLLRWEGHYGHPYWPGGRSGVTLDPGCDLGWCDPKLLDLYLPVVGSHRLREELQPLLGLRGADAQRATNSPRLSVITIGRLEASTMMTTTNKGSV